MFGKFKRKKSEEPIIEGIEDTEASDTQTETSDMPAKKKFSSTDLVFGGGLVLIVGGMFWVLSGGLGGEDATQTAETSKESNRSIVESQKPNNAPAIEAQQGTQNIVEIPAIPSTAPKEEAAPYAYENQLDFSSEGLAPPPDSYEQNNTAIAKAIAKTEPKVEKTDKPTAKQTEPKVAVAKETLIQTAPMQANELPSEKEHRRAPAVRQIETKKAPIQEVPMQEAPMDEASAKYVCSIVQAYQDMVGKEIMYYTKEKKSHSYLPAYSQTNWDESGVVVQKRLMALEVDIKERMVEIGRGKWIPALEFMRCVVLEEHR